MTRKAAPFFYEGHKILRISDLPFTQSSLFSGWVKPTHFMVSGEKTDVDCVNYEYYEFWYQHHFIGECDFNEML